MKARRPALAPADLERLRAARAGATVDLRRSLFGPASVTWRVNRETALVLGGGRALLLSLLPDAVRYFPHARRAAARELHRHGRRKRRGTPRSCNERASNS